MGLRQTLFGYFLKANLTHERHVYGGGEGDARVVGANVRRGFFATYVLLAGLHGEHKGTVSLDISGSADNAPGHVA